MDFTRFRTAFGRGDAEMGAPEVFASLLEDAHGVAVPPELVALWRECGHGRFADGVFHVFGEATSTSLSIVEWNELELWREIFKPARKGGPVFFAETAFGDQIGFSWRDGVCRATFAVVDTNELFVMADPFAKLFADVLVSRDAVVDPVALAAARAAHGPLPPGMHYAPAKSALLGDDRRTAVEKRVAHVAGAIIAAKLGGSRSKVREVKLRWM